MYEGTTGDMVELELTESFSVKQQVLLSAAEAAAMILRVDDIIKVCFWKILGRVRKISTIISILLNLPIVSIYLASGKNERGKWTQNFEFI